MKAKTLPECIDGTQAFKRFDGTVDALLAVPHAELVKREQAYQEYSRSKAVRPGPKPKKKRKAVKPSA